MQALTPAALPPVSVEAVLSVALAVVVAIAVAMLAGRATRRLLRRIDSQRPEAQTLADNTVRTVRRVAFVLTVLVVTFPALELAGVNIGIGLRADDILLWLGQNGLRILLLVVLAFGTNELAALVIRRAEAEVGQGDDLRSLERRKRFHTLGATFRGFLSVLIWSAAGLMILRELGVDITPVLTGAGILGLAIGFGAQTLVKDIISGFFLIAENQARVGDVVVINGTAGTVEEINLRTVVLRDLEGIVHTIASGEIRTLANRTKDYSFAVIDVGGLDPIPWTV